TRFINAGTPTVRLVIHQHIESIKNAKPEAMSDDDWDNLSNGVSNVYNMGNYFIKVSDWIDINNKHNVAVRVSLEEPPLHDESEQDVVAREDEDEAFTL
ncbi:hypothetical protein FBU31_007623, partial [Coemansia sp. 'formosensis']